MKRNRVILYVLSLLALFLFALLLMPGPFMPTAQYEKQLAERQQKEAEQKAVSEAGEGDNASNQMPSEKNQETASVEEPKTSDAETAPVQEAAPEAAPVPGDVKLETSQETLEGKEADGAHSVDEGTNNPVAPGAGDEGSPHA